jgi:hypothetical protein
MRAGSELASKLGSERPDETLISKAVIGVVPDDHMIQYLYAHQVCRPDEFPGKGSVLL